LPVGTLLRPNPKGYTSESEANALESLFEQYRPPRQLSRRKAVFMVAAPDEIDAAGGYTDYIYKVEPEGAIEKHDLAWYTEAEIQLALGNVEAATSAIHSYWRGIPFPNAERSLFEYLAPAAVVVAELEGDGESD
jgi:hypothetical protein